MARTTFYLTCLCLILGTKAFADADQPQKIQFGVSYELIISNNSDLIDLAGPDSSIGAPADYAVGGWKFDLAYDLDRDYQVGLGFKSINGKSLSFAEDLGSANPVSLILNSNALGVVAEGKRIFHIAPGFEASFLADGGFYWLDDSSLAATTGGGGNLSASTLGLFVGAGLKFYFDKEDNLGLGLDCGYQLLNFSPVATSAGNLANHDGSQAAIDMSGFTVMIDCVQVSFDMAPPKDKPMEAPPQDGKTSPLN